MGDDYGVSGKERGIRVEPLFEVGSIRYALHSVVQLAQAGDGFLRSRLSDTMVTVEEEVVSRILRSDHLVVNDRELAYPWQNEVLEDRSGCRRSRDDQNFRRF